MNSLDAILTIGSTRMLRSETGHVPYLVFDHDPTIGRVVVLRDLLSGHELRKLHGILSCVTE